MLQKTGEIKKIKASRERHAKRRGVFFIGYTNSSPAPAALYKR